jgi:hypothetical protein
MGNRIEQGRCCEAVIRIFEKLIGSNRKELCLPDTVNRRTKDIEAFVRIGATKLAIEHTLIEPFEHFLKSNHDFGRFKSELGQLVPPCKIPASMGFSCASREWLSTEKIKNAWWRQQGRSLIS